tara:strand:+ start:1138 stop:1557 length:420 start_codon:yes stop_codon:yes gene_type:complete
MESLTDSFEPDAEIAFERSGNYEWRGQPLHFSRRHYYAALAIANESSISAEEQVLLAFWIATHDEEEIKSLRSRWRIDKESVFDEFEDVPDRFDLAPGSEEMVQVAGIVESMWQDVAASKDVALPPEENEKGEYTGPGK